jgi:hypothetical protein
MNRWLVSWIVRSGKTKALVKDMITLYRISTRYDNREGQNCYRIKHKGWHQFRKYPTAVATRCFAFDPTENQPDDTKGLIMIPNVGNMSFYMSTMMCDFASELLSQFEAIVRNHPARICHKGWNRTVLIFIISCRHTESRNFKPWSRLFKTIWWCHL